MDAASALATISKGNPSPRAHMRAHTTLILSHGVLANAIQKTCCLSGLPSLVVGSPTQTLIANKWAGIAHVTMDVEPPGCLLPACMRSACMRLLHCGMAVGPNFITCPVSVDVLKHLGLYYAEGHIVLRGPIPAVALEHLGSLGSYYAEGHIVLCGPIPAVALSTWVPWVHIMLRAILYCLP